MNPQFILFSVLGAVVLLVLVANDYAKRQSVESAERRGEHARRDLYTNRTPWPRLIVLATGFVLLAYVFSHPEPADRDLGPLNPIVRWLLSKPPGLK